MVNGIDEILDTLNSSEDLTAFVCDMRKKFKESLSGA
jgi:hypothetical protein